MKKYPPEILRLLTTEGFNQAFDEILCEHETQKEAYEALEETYMDYFTMPCYSDFQSFRNSRYAYLAKKKRDAPE